MKPVAILGSGPAGLLAAHAVGRLGKPIAIISLPTKSNIGGAQFLHCPIPDLTETEPDAQITFRKSGDAQTYERKVYGDQPVPFVSFSGVEDGETQPAWNLRNVYDYLWEMLAGGGSSLNAQQINGEWLEENKNNFETIISSVPAPAICLNPNHFFLSQEIWVADATMGSVPMNTVLYDGTRDVSWYRSSNLFGFLGTEWGGGKKPPYGKPVSVRKPIRTNCDCHPNILRVGRYGTWKKGVLTHHAFFDASEWVY